MNRKYSFVIRILMAENGFVRDKELYEKAGINKNSFSSLMNGKTNPKVETIGKLCSVLNIPLSEFFDRVEIYEQDSTHPMEA